MSENPYQSPNTVDLRLADQPRHRSFRLTAAQEDHREVFRVGTLSDAIRFSLIQQLPILVFTSLVLDGGMLFRSAAIAVVAFWCVAGIALLRRGTELPDSDVLLVKWGFLPGFLIVHNAWQIAGLLF